MNREDLVKALNKIQLLLQLSEAGMQLIRHNGERKDRMIVCDAIAKVLGRPMDKKEKAKLRNDEREYEIWCYTRMYEGVEDFEDVCSNIIMNPKLLEDYPPLFGNVFQFAGRIQNLYLDGVKQLEQVASVLVLCEKYMSEGELEDLFGVFLIEEKCLDMLAKVPRLAKYFDQAPDPAEADAMYINLLNGFNNGTVN